MTRYFLLMLFVAMLGARALGLELSPVPGLSIKNAALYLTAVVIAIQAALSHDRKLELWSVLTPFGLLCLYAAFTWLISIALLDRPYYAPRATLIRLKGVLADQLLMLAVFFYGVVKLKDALWLAKMLLWVIVISSFITIVDTYNIPDLGIVTTRDKDGRVEGIIGGAQEFGGLMAFFLPAIAALWWRETGIRRLFALIGIGLTLAGVLLSASRGAVLGVLAGSMLAAFYLRRFIPTQTFLRVSAAALVLSLMTVIVLMTTSYGDLVTERMTHGIGAGDAHVLSSGRTTIWRKALREMMDSPLSFITGFGWEIYFQRPGYRLAPHSVYVGHLYNLGLIGLVLFILPFVNSIGIARRALKYGHASAIPFLIAVVFGLFAWMIAMAFSDIEGPATYVWAWTGVVLRLAIASKEHVRPGSQAAI